jgi:hypothetical protein
MALARPAPVPVRWTGWLLVLLSLVLLVPALWISLSQGERVYGFLVEFKDRQSAANWRIVTACRYVAWAIGVLSAMHTILLTVFLFGRRSLATRTVLWMGLLLLIAMIIFWGKFMLPTVALMDSLRPH